MFRSLLYDHPQGLSFVLFGMWLYAVYVYVFPVYLSVGCLVVNDQTTHSKFRGNLLWDKTVGARS
jgi:hypothetical protein